MADWSNVADSVATAVGSVANAVSAYGPNDQAKAVRAAKQAGKYAAKLESKKYPSWDIKGTKELAKSMGINSRAEWKKARAEAEDLASDTAYNEVWQMYVKAKDAQINSIDSLTAQQQTELALQQANSNEILQNKGVGVGGCLGVSCFIGGTGAFLSWLLYYVSNL